MTTVCALAHLLEHPPKKRFENMGPISKYKVKDVSSINYFRKTERKEDLNVRMRENLCASGKGCTDTQLDICMYL